MLQPTEGKKASLVTNNHVVRTTQIFHKKREVFVLKERRAQKNRAFLIRYLISHFTLLAHYLFICDVL
jgi:hypothetical protein